MAVLDPQSLILEELSRAESVDTRRLAEKFGIDHQALIGAANSLASKIMVVTELHEQPQWQLTGEGEEILQEGSHEAKIFKAVPPEGISQADLLQKVPSASIGLGKAIKAGWVALQAGLIKRKVETIRDVTQEQLLSIKSSPGNPALEEASLKELKKRKLANSLNFKFYVLTKGTSFSLTVTQMATDLTAEMLASGEWKNLTFKKYNFEARGAVLECGHLHPLLKVREEFRNIFLEMGFAEMPTNNFVESSFWNFDSLFQPQQHPARDAHDTFFIKDPERAHQFPEKYLQTVKQVHAEGGFGSLGYRYDWKLEEAQKNILRTHTTAVSARMLYNLAQQEHFTPAKFFSIDRVFRNEALDATHLAEFHQIEGLIADFDLSLGDLIGVLEAFFLKLGMSRLRFKPAYNPYTEPSMEVFAFHEGLKRWIEVGNSGVFRPEMLLPMGLPPGVTVIAWGLSLERPTMIKYALNDIRDLCGHRIDLKVVQRNPICRLEKD